MRLRARVPAGIEGLAFDGIARVGQGFGDSIGRGIEPAGQAQMPLADLD